MKKTLLAAALLAGYTGTALAQNSVTLYGRITPAYVFESVKLNDTAASTLNNTSGTYNQFSPASGYVTGGNNIGFKGVEDLGNGLKVGFKYEFGFNGQTGVESDQARESHVTVSNAAWGSLELGYGYTASSTILSGISPVGTSYGVMSAEDAFSVFSVSAGNQVKYFSPSISGFTVGLSYSFKGTKATDSGGAVGEGDFGTSNKNRLMVGGLRYANGPVLLAAAYTQLNPNQSEAVSDKNIKNWTVGGTYDLKVVKVHGAYGQNIDGIFQYDNSTFGDIKNPASPDVNPADGIAANIRTNQWMFGLSAPVGPGKALFSISQMKPGGDLTLAKNAAGNDAFATMTNFGVAYEYSLSKRTSIKASYGYATNYAMISGLTVNQVGVGLQHVF